MTMRSCLTPGVTLWPVSSEIDPWVIRLKTEEIPAPSLLFDDDTILSISIVFQYFCSTTELK